MIVLSCAVCAVFVGVLSTHTVDFLEFFPGNRNYHQDDVECHELQFVCHCESCHCDVEDEDAADGFFLRLRIFALYVDEFV